MLIVSLIFVAVALVLIGVGLAVGLVACAFGACLLGLGVLSSSVFVGVYSRRPALALRAFLVQCGVLGGLSAGVIGVWLWQSLLSSVDQATWAVLGAGALGGMAGGLCVALLLDLCLRRLHGWAAPSHALQRTACGHR